MARRRIGQERLQFGAGAARRSGSLGEIAGLIDWSEIDRHLAVIYGSAKGEPAWPPLSLFKALPSSSQQQPSSDDVCHIGITHADAQYQQNPAC